MLWNRSFIIACVANFLTACSFNLLMPTIPLYLVNELGIEHSKIGIILSSYALGLLLIRPFSGYLVDSFPRKLVYLVGIISFITIFFGYFYAVTFFAFTLLRFIHGVFWALTTVSANTTAIDIIPSSRRAEGIGYFGANMNIAMAIAPFFAMGIYETSGFVPLISIAIGMGILAIIAVSMIKVPYRDLKKIDRPPLSLDRFILVKGLPILFNQLFISIGWGTLVAYAILYGKEIGIEQAAYFFLFLAFGIMISRILSGKMVDKGHMHKVIIFAISTLILSFFSFAYFHSMIAYNISALCIGIGYGTLLPALQTIYINMAPASQRGTANSTYLTGFDIGVGLGMLVGARVIAEMGYQAMYYITATSCAIGLLLYILISRKVYDKNRLR